MNSIPGLEYHRGHLIANVLGGPGNDERNLVPLSSGSNQQMRKFEILVKNELYKEDTYGAPP